MPELDDLLRAAAKLTSERVRILIEMAGALSKNIETEINSKSDLMTPAFVGDFTARLIVYHAMHEEKLTKKTFEYMFRGASAAAGKIATITSNPVNPGADVTVDGVKFSLKTEAVKSISSKHIHISKFMEARWIRECQIERDFAREASRRIPEHLASYDRIIILRAIDLPDERVKYEFIELPLKLLLMIKKLTAADFTRRTKNGSSTAKVKMNGQPVFTLRLDGSVEKVTISGMSIERCLRHGSWILA